MGNSSSFFEKNKINNKLKFVLIGDELKKVAYEISKSLELKYYFIKYIKNSNWIDDFIEILIENDTRNYVYPDFYPHKQLYYSGNNNILWTTHCLNELQFYVNKNIVYNSNNIDENFHENNINYLMYDYVSNKTRLIPVVIGLGLKTYINTKKYYKDKVNINSNVNLDNKKYYYRTNDDGNVDPNKSIMYKRIKGLILEVLQILDDNYLDLKLSEFFNIEHNNYLLDYLVENTNDKYNKDCLLWLVQLFDFFENLPIAISIALTKKSNNTTFPLVYLNKEFENLTKYNRYTILGKNCRFLHSEQYTEFTQREKIRNSLLNMRSLRISITNVRNDNTPFHNLLALTPVKKFESELNNNNHTDNIDNNKNNSDNSTIYTLDTSNTTNITNFDDLNNFNQDNITCKLCHDFDEDFGYEDNSKNFTHIIGLQYNLTNRKKINIDVDLHVIEDIVSFLYGLLL